MAHKLLLADDSVTIQRVIELTFADEDVQVLTAGDGEQAIASIQAERPDIVLADIGMPKRSGYEVAAFVKNAPGLSHIPVLLLTGAFEPVDERRAQAAGCDGVLVKPFEPQHVIARVRELLQGLPSSTPRAAAVTRAVSDVPRPVERLTPPRPAPPRPAAAPAPEPARSTQQGVQPGSDLDDYFDRLDAAFATISTPGETPGAPPEPVHRHEGPVMERDLDWFDTTRPQAAPARERAPAVEPAAAPAPPTPEPPPATFASPPAPPAWPLPQPPSIEPSESPRDMPPLAAQSPTPRSVLSDAASPIADAFSALLAAEQGEPDAPPVRLSITGSAPAMTDELLDEIARRVVDRFGSHAVHEMVSDVVSRVAERLVREEIARIRGKNS